MATKANRRGRTFDLKDIISLYRLNAMLGTVEEGFVIRPAVPPEGATTDTLTLRTPQATTWLVAVKVVV